MTNRPIQSLERVQQTPRAASAEVVALPELAVEEPGDPARQTSRQPRRRPHRDARDADLLALRQRAERRVHYLLGTQDGKCREPAIVDPRDLPIPLGSGIVLGRMLLIRYNRRQLNHQLIRP